MEKLIITKESKYFDELMQNLHNQLKSIGCDHSYRGLMVACAVVEIKNNIQIDLHGTMEYMKSKGGYCDCEIMLNVLFVD